jgi:hypothetical protein
VSEIVVTNALDLAHPSTDLYDLLTRASVLRVKSSSRW